MDTRRKDLETYRGSNRYWYLIYRRKHPHRYICSHSGNKEWVPRAGGKAGGLDDIGLRYLVPRKKQKSFKKGFIK